MSQLIHSKCSRPFRTQNSPCRTKRPLIGTTLQNRREDIIIQKRKIQHIIPDGITNKQDVGDVCQTWCCFGRGITLTSVYSLPKNLNVRVTKVSYYKIPNHISLTITVCAVRFTGQSTCQCHAGFLQSWINYIKPRQKILSLELNISQMHKSFNNKFKNETQ